MPRAKISEFSTTAGDNTDIDGINIAEGCAPSGINDAIRELMAQLKDFQSGAAGDNITVVGTLAAKGTSASGADLKLYEDTDNGTNYVGFIAPASIASNVQWTLPSADGSSGQALQTNGSGTLSFATLGISAGGTGQTTANAAFNALAPSQTSNAGRYLKTDGTNTSWDLLDISTADITGTLPVANGGTGITSFGTGVATALGINVGSSGAFVTNGGALGTPSSGTVTNLTGTASININGTVGATTPNTGSFTTLTTSSTVTINGGTANGVPYLNASKVLTTGSALTFNGSDFGVSASVATATLASSGAYSALFFTNSGGAGTSGTILVNSSGILQSRAATHAYTNADASTEYMRLTSTGLGIGTSSPDSKLTVVDGTNSIVDALTTGGARTRMSSNASTGFSGTTTNHPFVFVTNATERMRLDSSGNLGIGTSSPSTALDVASSNSGITLTNTGASNKKWRVGGNAAASFVITESGVADRMFIDTSGNLGLGIADPGGYRLNVRTAPATNQLDGTYVSDGTRIVIVGQSGATYNYAGIVANENVIYSSANPLNIVADVQFIKFSTGTERARITSGGDLLVGATSATNTASTGARLYASGAIATTRSESTDATGNFTVYSTGAAATRFYVGMGGTVYATNTTISAISDQRFKENIQDLDVGLDKIMALKPRKFDWKAGKGKDIKGDRGFIAQEFEQVFPDLIDEWKDPAPEGEEPYKSVRADLIPVLVKAIQELKSELDSVKAELATLKGNP